VCFDISYISHSQKKWKKYEHKRKQTDLDISTRYFCQILVILKFSRQILEKHSYMKLHKNPSSGSWAVSCGRTDRHADSNTDVQTGTRQSWVACRQFAKTPKNAKIILSTYQTSFEPGSSDSDAQWAKAQWWLVRENYLYYFLFRSIVLQVSVTPDKWLQGAETNTATKTCECDRTYILHPQS